VGLIDFAAGILAGKSSYKVSATVHNTNGERVVSIRTEGVSRLDSYIDGRPKGSYDVDVSGGELTMRLQNDAKFIALEGFDAERHVMHKRIVLGTETRASDSP
jgi:hypothetical protein